MFFRKEKNKGKINPPWRKFKVELKYKSLSLQCTLVCEVEGEGVGEKKSLNT